MSGKRNHTNHRVGEWHGRAKYSDALVKEAREMAAMGFGYRKIGKTLGVPCRTVADWVRLDTRWAL